MDNTQRDIGRLEAVAESLKEQNEALQKEIKELKAEVAEIKNLISQIKGGSRVLMFVGGLASGGMGAALFKWIPLILAR